MRGSLRLACATHILHGRKKDTMTWKQVRIPKATEANLGDALEQQLSHADGVGPLLGIPAWLANIRSVSRELPIPLFEGNDAGSCRVDLVGTNGGENFVFELKHAAKYEPIALAEALHHAEVMEHKPPCSSYWTPSSPVTAVLITQWNAWLRAACARLWRQIKEPARLRLLEVQVLNLPGAGLSFWISEVHPDGMKSSKLPSELPDSVVAALGDVRWHQSPTEAGGWQASRENSDQVVAVVKDPQSGGWVVWAGKPTELGTYWFVDGESGDPPELWQ